MQSAQATRDDSSARVVPPPRPASAWRVVKVEVLPGKRLSVAFADGTRGEVDLRAFLDGSGVTGTVFEPLRDPEEFARARVDLGAVTWPSGADLAPDAMYDAIREEGRWIITE